MGVFINNYGFCSYGQTGTGKTYTMEGERSPDGALSWEEVHVHVYLYMYMYIRYTDTCTCT